MKRNKENNAHIIEMKKGEKKSDKSDNCKTNPKRYHKLNQNFVDLLGKYRVLISSLKMSSRGIYFIDLGCLGFLMYMPKIKEKCHLSKSHN